MSELIIQDLFYSVQGEGPWIGYPQFFVRFFACNIHCNYCDTPDENRTPMTCEQVMAAIEPYRNRPLHSISITGGEPLMQVEGLKVLLPHLKDFDLYLETNGTLPKHLAEVVDHFRYFSVDYKPGFAKEFTDFMLQLKGREGVFVKLVVTRNFPVSETKKLAGIMAAIDPTIPLVLQPVTPFGAVKHTASPDDLMRTLTLASQSLSDVRVIPQTHKLIGWK